MRNVMRKFLAARLDAPSGEGELVRVSELRGRGIDQEVVDLLHDRGIDTLTAVQAAAVKAGVLDGASVVISAPTSAGKTLVGELLAAKHAGLGATVFLVSHRALARQLHGLLATRYVRDEVPFLRVGIATGDEDSVRGEWKRFDAIVSTYEKFYGACVAYPGLITALHAVVADELQIIGDRSRGHTAELVLAMLVAARKGRAVQIVGLSATVANGAELADWLGATHVNVTERVPPLEYEVWTHGQRAVYSHGAESPRILKSTVDPSLIKDAVAAAFRLGCEPLVVMASTKQKAMTYADLASGNFPVDEGFPLSVVEAFRAHDETPAATKRIAALLQRRIGVHHADLTPEQRAVIEDAFANRQLRLLCATTTLVAGVNLPIRAVLYPELTRWDKSRDADVLISVEEFRNGTGRAGRLGFHDKGTAIVLAETRALATAADRMITGEPAPVESRLDDRSVEWTLLHFLAARRAATVDALVDLAASTFWGHQQKLGQREDLRVGRAAKFRKILSDDRWRPCWRKDGDLVRLTEAGREIARSGLEPSHVIETMEEVRRFGERVDQGTPLARAKGEYIARVCLLACMQDMLPGRAKKRVAWSYQCGYVSKEYLGGAEIDPLQIVAIAHALHAAHLHEYPPGVSDDMVEHSGERAWIAEAIARLTRAASSASASTAPIGTEGAMLDLERLAGQLECQVPAEAVLIFKVLREQRVPNMSRKKVLDLAERVAGEVGRVLAMEDGQLAGIVGKKQVGQVRKAVLEHLAGLTREQSARQLEEAREDPEIEKVIEPLLRLQGERFQVPVRAALEWIGWPLHDVDQAGPRKKPDLDGTDEHGTPVVVECKTALDLGGEVSQEEAMALCKKAPEGFAGCALTVGRPVFSDAAIEAAIRRHKAWPHNRLVTAGALAELILSIRFRGLPRAAALDLLRTALCLDVSRVVAEVRRLVDSPAAAAAGRSGG